jgi:hypothetical protein
MSAIGPKGTFPGRPNTLRLHRCAWRLECAGRPAIDTRKCGWWTPVHVEALRKFHDLFGLSRFFPGDMPGAATVGADRLG